MSEENPGNGSLYDEDEAFHDDLDNSLEHGENTFVEIPGLDSQLLQQAWERLTETNKEQRETHRDRSLYDSLFDVTRRVSRFSFACLC